MQIAWALVWLLSGAVSLLPPAAMRAEAADVRVRGTRLSIRNRPAKGPRANALTWAVAARTVVAGAPASPDDPRCNGAQAGTVRATLRVFGRETGQDTGPIPLPCEHWVLLGREQRPRGYKYVDRRGASGPCRLVKLRDRRRVIARCRSAGPIGRLDYDLRPAMRETQVAAVLQMGALRLCSSFEPAGKRDGRNGRRFVGRSAAAPSACPEPSGVPPEMVRNASGWPLPNRNYASTRTATASSISAATVTDLRVAWRFPTPGIGGFGNLSTNPIVVDGVVYLQELSSEVHALDLATGARHWSVQLEVVSPGPNGVAVAYGRVFAANGRGEVVALDAESGEELWRTELRRTPSEGIDIQPIVFNRHVYVSTVPVSLGGLFTGGDTGVLHALDVASGAVRWRFDTVDSPDLWGNPAVNAGGGAWYPPAIDVTRGVTYWGTGNPAPFPGTTEFPNASSRPGPNLYTDSVLAIGAADGGLRWYNQVAPHDLLDHDFPLTALAELDGTPVVVGAGKTGTVHVFDAATGAERWETSVGMHFADDLEAYPLGVKTLVAPGLFGGVITPPAVADGVVYVAVLNFPTPYQGDETDPFAFAGIESATSEVVALDLATGAPLWTRDFPAGNFGAATVVADLLINATNDGTVRALDRATGATVWSDRPGVGINAWPAVVGDTLLIPAGIGATPELIAYRLP